MIFCVCVCDAFHHPKKGTMHYLYNSTYYKLTAWEQGSHFFEERRHRVLRSSEQRSLLQQRDNNNKQQEEDQE
jgi:hypothetical protein